MSTHITVRLPSEPERKHKAAHHDDNQEPAGWSKHREPLEEKHISSLTAGAGHDKWAQRAEKHSGPAFAPGTGKSSR